MQRSWLVNGFAVALTAIGLPAFAGRAEADGHRRSSSHPSVPPSTSGHWQRYSWGGSHHQSPGPYFVSGPRYYSPPVYYARPYGYGYGISGVYVVSPYSSGYYGSPYVVYPPAATFEPNMYSNPVLQGTLWENQLRWGTGSPPIVPSTGARPRYRPSTPEQQAKSLHAQAQGDVWFRKSKFLDAYGRYKLAISIAADRPEPYFRMAFALAAIGSFDSAVKYFKQGLDLDPSWPTTGDRLDVLFGDSNRLAVLTLTERVMEWVRDDIRDPDRLFLIGVLLHFQGDNRAAEFFQSAYRLAGSGDHLLAFLRPTDAAPNGAPAQPQQNAVPAAPQQQQGAPNGVAPPMPMEPPVGPPATAPVRPPSAPIAPVPQARPAQPPAGSPPARPSGPPSAPDTAPKLPLPPLPTSEAPRSTPIDGPALVAP